ncbi:uncharacterized protein H6S33_003232 [Morchella sextelata]|uniref:uncharacterized protein n=1 Tax=Morchella sextelata TaxID=1174677 RepID=UPI001D055F3A|nr:uncharacterized protein H6S33_003232 [Morchella sextelata]KAH0607244.1 hypothetical protein H6S33_003232 [Morchella sextelata]
MQSEKHDKKGKMPEYSIPQQQEDREPTKTPDTGIYHSESSRDAVAVSGLDDEDNSLITYMTLAVMRDPDLDGLLKRSETDPSCGEEIRLRMITLYPRAGGINDLLKRLYRSRIKEEKKRPWAASPRILIRPAGIRVHRTVGGLRLPRTVIETSTQRIERRMTRPPRDRRRTRGGMLRTDETNMLVDRFESLLSFQGGAENSSEDQAREDEMSID